MDSQLQLEQAIRDGDLTRVEESLRGGADVNKRVNGQLPACMAISDGEEEIAICLLRHGTDLSLPPLRPPGSRRGARPRPAPGVSDGFFAHSLRSAKDAASSVAVSAAMIYGLFALHYWLPNRATRHVCGILDPFTPLGSEFVHLFKSSLPWPTQPFQGRRHLMLLLGIHWLSHLLHGVPKAWAEALLSWSLRGTFGRVLVLWASDVMIQRGLQLARRSREPAPTVFAGLEVTETFLASGFKSEQLLLALLEQGLFSTIYVEKSVGSAPENRLIAAVWEVCAHQGYITAIQELMDLGVPVDFNASSTNSGRIKNTALSMATWRRDVRLVEILLGRGADANARTSHWGPTPLILAFQQRPPLTDKNHEIQRLVTLLIDAGAMINLADGAGRTALSYAAEFSSIEVFRALLRHGADPRVVDLKGSAAAHYACWQTDAVDFMDLLLEYETIAELDIPNNNGYTPFLFTVSIDRVDLADRLIKAGADPFVVTSDGLTALQLAALYGPEEMLKLLLRVGVDVNAGTMGGETALVRACRRTTGRALPVLLLLEGGAETNVVSQHGFPLHLACRWSSRCRKDPHDYSDQLETIRLLIKHGAEVNAEYTNERMHENVEKNVTPIGLVASHAPIAIKAKAIGILLEAGAKPNGLDDRRRPALLAVCSKSCDIDSEGSAETECIELLLLHGADVGIKDYRGMTCFHHAAGSKNFRAMKACLEHLPIRPHRLDIKDSLGRTPLHIACDDTHWMSQADYREWSRHMRSGNTAYANWHVSLESSLTLSLLRIGDADPYEEDTNSATALHMAAKAGNPRIMAILLLWTGPSLLYDFPDRCQRLAFHYAVRSVDVTQMLIRYYQHNAVIHDEYFDVVQCGEEEVSSRIHIVGKMLERVGEEMAKQRHTAAYPDAVWDEHEHPMPWRVGVYNSRDQFGNTPLHYAVVAGCVGVVRLYMDVLGADASVTNNDGETALDFSMAHGHRECAAVILEKAPEMARGIALDKGFATSNDVLPCRKAAVEFVKELEKTYIWGVYGEAI
ncbi:hypothetical protein MAPG_00266 [Magnaporthiopsis poae ATCC 64411]|uniref:Uncharacterized protein n=1 Tax=Magnaporthiopsis poae (strain ATCC 64411 / 73-15) TaxID=644358 RepID=A0A0C4DKJ2_MAGP6|nr:hypothetical protein MAPG_00266 [Magnaporthiopsis poae ATCC 64411]